MTNPSSAANHPHCKREVTRGNCRHWKSYPLGPLLLLVFSGNMYILDVTFLATHGCLYVALGPQIILSIDFGFHKSHSDIHGGTRCKVSAAVPHPRGRQWRVRRSKITLGTGHNVYSPRGAVHDLSRSICTSATHAKQNWQALVTAPVPCGYRRLWQPI